MIVRKYGYPELDQKRKCITCMGCNRLELKEFVGTYRCENYVGGNENGHDNRRYFETHENDF